jgi:hypothetical protein
MAFRALAGVLLAAAPALAAAPPVVFAVDTSRSLTPGDLADVRSTIEAVLAALPAEQPAGLLAFDDAPRWLVPLPGSPRAVRAALPELAPQGDFTLLHDALFMAVRALPDGGVVLLATDGRDESSATTVEDVAALAQRQRVRLLPLLIGRRDGSLPLRRLALLTDGTYLGRATGEQTARRVRSALDELAAEAPAATPVEDSGAPAQAASSEAAPAAAPPVEPVEPTEPAPGIPDWMAWLVGILVLAALALGVFAVRRRPRPRPAFCPTCGSELAEDGTCVHCAEGELQERLARRPIARLEDTAELALSALEAIEPEAPEPGVLERTRVLAEHHVIQLREPGRPSRSFLLRREEAFAIGRDAGENTLAVGDPALSARHLKIVPEDGMFYVVDLGSTNGTFLGEERIEARRLRPGDVIRAGQLTIEYRLVTRPLG